MLPSRVDEKVHSSKGSSFGDVVFHTAFVNSVAITLSAKEEPSLNKNLMPRTLLHYGIMILIFAGFLTLLIWNKKKLHRKFSRKANEYVSESDA